VTEHVPEAGRAAQRAADAARASIRELAAMTDLEAAVALFDEIWQPAPGTQPISAELMKALSKAGNYITGAYDVADGELIGACVAFFGPPARKSLHSHIAGVSAAGLRRGVGFALKAHQRAWALQRDTTEVAWTFDPLVRRNAYFNLVKLAARPAEYLPNFYGGMHDAINIGADTDRLLVTWDLLAAPVAAACAGMISAADAAAEIGAGASVALAATGDGYPALAPGGPPAAATVLVAVPGDIEALRASDPGAAAAWRSAVRATLGELIGAGGRVTGFDRAGWYVISFEAQGVGA
jgi:predicted GNAT superfamily acetyltransferase